MKMFRLGSRPELQALALTLAAMLSQFVPPIVRLLRPVEIPGFHGEISPELLAMLPDPRAIVVLLGVGVLGAIVGFCHLELERLRT